MVTRSSKKLPLYQRVLHAGCAVLFFLQLVLQPITAHAAVGNIDATPAVERVSVGSDGHLYAWNKEGDVLAGWPQVLSGRHFVLQPRLVDVDLDLQEEIVAVSEADAGGNPKIHVFKGNGTELTQWSFSPSSASLTEPPYIADVNHDSSLDIIVSQNNSVSVFRRNFQPIANFTKSFTSTPYVSVGDPDNNGRQDLFAAVGNTLQSWDEQGNLSTIYMLPEGETILGHAAIVDINNDSYPDFVFVTSAARILAIDRSGNDLLEIHLPSGVKATSEVVISDLDQDRSPEIIVVGDNQKTLAFKTNGAALTSWTQQLGFREGEFEDGVVANDKYEGLFGSAVGWDQLNIYRNKNSQYAKIRLGENVHEYDDAADFDFIDTIDVSDVWSFPKPFTPNGDGVNDTTQVHYRLSDDAMVALDLYDGNEKFISRIHDPVLRSAGENTESWSGMDTNGTVTTRDDVPLGTGVYIIKVVAQSADGFVTVAKAAAIINGVKAKIEGPIDTNEEDAIYPKVYGSATISGIAVDPNFGENNLDADFQSYKLYYRTGVWKPSDQDVAKAGELLSSWSPVPVPLRSQCPNNLYAEPNDGIYPNSNVSCRPIDHGILGTWDTLGSKLPNGDYTLLLKVMDSSGNTLGKFQYDTLVVTVANPSPTDPFDPTNIYDPANPNNPIYTGPKISNVALSSPTISLQSSSTTISYALNNETSDVHVTIYPDGATPNSPAAAVYSFNHLAPNDPGNPIYQFTWNGTNTLGRNVSGGLYHVQITANAVDGTGVDVSDTLTVTVSKGFSSSDTLAVSDTSPTSGQSSFMAVPSHFDPLGFGADLQAEKTTISYQLTKDAKITVQVLEDVFGQVVVPRKTLVSNVIQKSGAVTWDGTGDNGIIVGVGKDYIVRLTAQAIDIGNTETITKDIVVHLDSSTLNSNITADISEMVGGDGEDVLDGDPTTAMLGNPNFLWRAAGTGVVDIPFTYTITASGREKYNLTNVPLNDTQPVYVCKINYPVNGVWLDASNGLPDSNQLACMEDYLSKNFVNNGGLANAYKIATASVQAPYSISSFAVEILGLSDAEWAQKDPVYLPPGFQALVPTSVTANNFVGVNDVFAMQKGDTKSFVSAGSPAMVDAHSVSFKAIGTTVTYAEDGSPSPMQPYGLAHLGPSDSIAGCMNTNIPCGSITTPMMPFANDCPGFPHSQGAPAGYEYPKDFAMQAATLYKCGSIHLTGSASGVGERGWPLPQEDPNKYSISGNANISTTSNPLNNLASYNGQVGSGQGDVISSWLTGYGLTLTNKVNGVTTNASSDGSTISIPGLQGWLTNGKLSAQIVQNGGVINSYVGSSHDPYLTNAPYQKVWGEYTDFNKSYYQRDTRDVSIYNEGYKPNIFSGNPGTNLYSFSNVVHLTGWTMDVRYPNVSVNQPDGDNLLDSGSGALGVFHLENVTVTAPGVQGTQNSNIKDTFRLRLKPDAVPRRFVEIKGSAAANYEMYYYDATTKDAQWHTIPARTTNPVNNGTLAHWDVTALNGQQYTVVVKSKNGDQVNIDTMDVGIGQWVDTDKLSGNQLARVDSTFKRASLIFGPGALVGGPRLVTIRPVAKDQAAFKLPSGIAPLGPIFDIKPDNISIDPKYHVQLEITFTPAELQEAFGVADASELTIYNLAGDEALEGLATVATLDTHDDSDPSNDVWRFTANLEHFSQYFVAKKTAGYVHLDSPSSGSYLNKTVTIKGRIEQAPRPPDQKTVQQPLASLSSLTISYFPQDTPANSTVIYSQNAPQPTTSLADINIPWDVSALNGNYILRISATGPSGAEIDSDTSVAIDNQAAQSTLRVNGQAVTDGASVTVAPGATVEIISTDSATNAWESGVKQIEYSVDGGAYISYDQPFTLFQTTGSHTLKYHSIDNNGNEESLRTATLVFQEKASNPQQLDGVQVSINGPQFAQNNQTWVSAASKLSFTTSGSQIDHVSYRVGSSDYTVYSQPISISTQETGNYTLEYFAVDTQGLRGDVYRKSLLYDVDPPMTAIAIQGPLLRQAATLVLSPTTTLTLSATDFGDFPSGLDRIETRWNQGTWQIYKDPMKFADSGALDIRAVDHLGNLEPEQHLAIKIDDVKPTMGITSIPSVISPNGDGRHDTAQIIVSASDNLYKTFSLNWVLTAKDGKTYAVYTNEPLKAGTNTLTWDGNVDGKLIPEGQYTYTLTITDAGGNVSDSYAGTLTCDVTPPVIAVKGANVRAFSPNGDAVSDVLQVDYTVTDNLFTDQIHTELAILTKGQYELLKTTDSVTSPPADHTLSWNGSDAIDNGVFDGDYNFQLTAEDPAGNRSQPQDGVGASTGDVFVDRFPPQTTLSVVGPTYVDGDKTWLGKDAKVALLAVDPPAASGVDKILYGFSDKESQTYAQPFALAADDTDYTLYYQAKDVIGNTEAMKTKKLRSDSVAPTSTLTIGAPKLTDDKGVIWISPKTQLTLAADDAVGVGVKDIKFEIKGARAPSAYDKAITFDGLADSTYQFISYAEDQLNNIESSHTQTIHLDGTPPKTTLVIADPQYQADGGSLYVSSSTKLSFKVDTDRGDLDHTEYRINDGAWTPAADIVLPQEGSYTISFRSYDTLGNVEVDQSQALIVDNTPPQPGLQLSQSAAGANPILTPGTLITLTATDGASSVAGIEYQIDDGPLTSYDKPFSLRGLTPGMHVITYRVKDRLGNISEFKMFALELVDVTVTREAFKTPRVLVFMLQTQDLRAADPRPSGNLLTAVSGDLDGIFTVIDGDQNDAATVEKMLAEMRSDKYSTFIFATDAFAVRFYDNDKVKNLLRELKARIYKGDTFINMAGYSDIQGANWTMFRSGFNPVSGSSTGLFPQLETGISFKQYGQGRIVEFSGDLGRLAKGNPTQSAVIQSGVEAMIRDFIPTADDNNAGEVSDVTFTYHNSGADPVQVATTDTLPIGWIQEGNGDEVLSPTYQKKLTIQGNQDAVVNYLYRSTVQPGTYDAKTALAMTWNNGLQSDSSFVTPYKIENTLIGLIDSLIGPQGLIADGQMPSVKDTLLGVKRRLFLENGQFNPDENASELIAEVLDAIDSVGSDPKQDQLCHVLSEIVEGIEIQRFKAALSENAPLGTGDPTNPESFHGDTASYLGGGGGGGGCSMIKANEPVDYRGVLLGALILGVLCRRRKKARFVSLRR